jgi:hypothetical protein
MLRRDIAVFVLASRLTSCEHSTCGSELAHEDGIPAAKIQRMLMPLREQAVLVKFFRTPITVIKPPAAP